MLQRKHILVLLSVCGAVFTAGWVVAEPPVPLAVVNGDTITTADMDRQFMTTHRQLEDDRKGSFDYLKLMQKLVNDRLIIQEASAIGMHEEDSFVDQLRKLQRDRASRLFVAETFKPEIDASEEDIRAQFEGFYFKIQLRTLAVATLDEAERLLAQVKSGAPMDSLARELSLDSRRYKGGLHNMKFWKDVPIVLRTEAQHLKPGELSAPFPFNEAYMFLRVEDRIEADPAELEVWTKEIATIITNTHKKEAWESFLDSLAGRFPAMTDSALLGKIEADSSVVFRGEFLRGSDRTVIQVGQAETVSEEELRREISYTAMNAADQVFDTIMHRAVTGITDQTRLFAAAEEQGFMDHRSVLDYLDRVRDSLLLENYLGENVVNRITFNHQEFEQYYQEHLDQFREPDEVQLKALQLGSQSDAEQAAVYLADGADFDYVAGRLGRDEGIDHDENQWFSQETFPDEVAQALKDLAAGQSTKPFQLTDGWAIFRLRARRPGAVKTMAEVDGQIREFMFQRKFNELLDALLTELKASSHIEYYQDAINEYLGVDI